MTADYEQMQLNLHLTSVYDLHEALIESTSYTHPIPAILRGNSCVYAGESYSAPGRDYAVILFVYF